MDPIIQKTIYACMQISFIYFKVAHLDISTLRARGRNIIYTILALKRSAFEGRKRRRYKIISKQKKQDRQLERKFNILFLYCRLIFFSCSNKTYVCNSSGVVWEEKNKFSIDI